MKKILVTGANGQLGQCLRKIHTNYPEYTFLFTAATDLDITNKEAILRFFEKAKPDYCLNFAAYTNVEQAEKAPEKAFLVNAEGAKNLAGVCHQHNTTLLHISTDYVFDGTKHTPYTPQDLPNPLNAYGRSKLEGERYIQNSVSAFFIIRTSWLYSEFGHNFYKTILEKSQTETALYITDQETGTPTNANELALFLMKIITSDYKNYGLYHFCGDTIMTWYDFARAIIKENNKEEQLKIVRTKNYHTFAQRPVYSALRSSVIRFEDEKHSEE